MAGRKENIKALFSNTRTRVIIIFTAAILLITSIPGQRDQTAQYAALQEAQNVSQARRAAESGKSAIPTIVSTQGFGEGVQEIGPKHGEGGVGFQTLARENIIGPQQSLWLESLKNSNCSKSTVNSVVTQGASLTDLKGACTCLQLKDDGYQYTDLKSVCACNELKAAGFNARQMKDAGSTAEQLRACGFDACELRAAGFAAQEMKDGGYGDGELKGAGFSENEIARTAGLPDGITVDDIHKAGCQPEALIRLKNAGVTASALRRISGCSVAQLKTAGFSAQDLKNAGFSAADLLKAGFAPTDLKQAYSPRDLLDAGVSPADVAAAGYSASELKDAEAKLPVGVGALDVKEAGCTVEALKREWLAGISAASIHQYAGCSTKDLHAAGFTEGDLANAGFTPAEISAILPEMGDDAIKAAGCDPLQLKKLFSKGVSAKRIHDLNGCSAAALKAANFNAQQLADAGFTPQQVLDSGFTIPEVGAVKPNDDSLIKAAGCDPQKLHALFLQKISAKRIHELNGCSAAALKAAGFSAKDLADAGFTPEELLAAGLTPQQLMQAGLSPVGIIAAGRTANCSVDSLKAAHVLGVSAATIKQTLGCSVKQMQDGGYTAQELKAAGFTAAELTNAGFSAAQLKDAGFSASDLRGIGFPLEQLKAAGYSAKDLKDAGFTAEVLNKAGFSAKDLKDAGFGSIQLKSAGFSAQALQDAGFSPNDTALAGLQALTQPTASSTVAALPSMPGANAGPNASAEAANACSQYVRSRKHITR